jgi:hypothetical protein
MGLDAKGFNPEIAKRIADAGLRKSWAKIKTQELKKLDPKEAKNAEKIFSKGLGPEIDNFYKLLAAKKIERKAVEKSHGKIVSIITEYQTEIGKSDFGGTSRMALNAVLKYLEKAVQDEWNWIDAHLG